jgi:hypothetical protein
MDLMSETVLSSQRTLYALIINPYIFLIKQWHTNLPANTFSLEQTFLNSITIILGNCNEK